MNSQRAYQKSFSFELFPPKSEAAELALKNTVAQLRQI